MGAVFTSLPLAPGATGIEGSNPGASVNEGFPRSGETNTGPGAGPVFLRGEEKYVVEGAWTWATRSCP
jgi:hypothetical protein